ncbi:hypothetical protein ONZ45_g14185 [Pleurotus djamor]|nr:hypothetical protein ONZ45_g14185 [Pleurotus djamor]
MFSSNTFVTFVFFTAVTVLKASARPCDTTSTSVVHSGSPIVTSPPAAQKTANAVSGACTQSRLDILVALTIAEDAAGKINATEPTTTAAVHSASRGFDLVRVGIAAIANGIQFNIAPPPQARDQVAQGLTQVKNALGSINGTYAADTNLALAQTTTDLAVNATTRVVQDCK